VSPKVFIFSPIEAAANTYTQLEQSGCEILVAPRPWVSPMEPSPAELVVGARDSDALLGSMIYNRTISREVLESSDHLRIVAKYSIGCEDIDVEAATELGILVTYGPTESNWGGVAEGALAYMLCLLKKVRERDRHLKTDGLWRDPSLMGTYVGARADGYPGITIGILGLGRVGTRLADLLRPWRARIIACDPYVSDAHFAAHGVQRVDFETLIAESDVLSLHVFLNRETRHIIGAAQLAGMKRSAILINASRGPVVDEGALVDALRNQQLAGAALDVFEQEPLPLDSPLRGLGDRVLLSPHMITNNAGSGVGPAIGMATNAVLSALHGQVPDPDIIFNREAISKWQSRFAGASLVTGGAAGSSTPRFAATSGLSRPDERSREAPG
jgi:D-3-phosphoglycerate dehydrogenase / 2-oxoglutarate reductase